LGWPRSDLAKENIAIRKRERTSWDDIGEWLAVMIEL
jgi:hypothetical protein